jgi:Bacterial mobilisation protein (MobC)
VQFTPSEREQLRAAARQEGAQMGEYVRQLCFRRGGQATMVAGTQRNPDAKRLADELNAIGNNLNQLTHVANATGDLHRLGMLDSTIELLVTTMSRVIALQ